MLNKGEGEKESPKFEVNFVVRDKTGKAIGGRKKLSSNSAKDLSEGFKQATPTEELEEREVSDLREGMLLKCQYQNFKTIPSSAVTLDG